MFPEKSVPFGLKIYTSFYSTQTVIETRSKASHIPRNILGYK